MKVILLALALVGSFASADMLTLLRGTYKELGVRCVDNNSYISRDKSLGDKFFTIGDGTYFHRVEMPDNAGCTSVQSAGNLHAVELSDRVQVSPEMLVEFHCPFPNGGGMYDDYSGHTRTLTLRMSNIQGKSYFVVGGDPSYRDEKCSNPVMEHVFEKQ